MAKTHSKVIFLVFGIFVVLVSSNPLFLKNSSGKKPKFFWDIFGVFGTKAETSLTSSYHSPSTSYQKPSYLSSPTTKPSYLPSVTSKPSYYPVKPSYGLASSKKPHYFVGTEKPPSYLSPNLRYPNPTYFPPSSNKPNYFDSGQIKPSFHTSYQDKKCQDSSQSEEGTSSSLNDGLRYNSNAGNTFLSQDGTHFPHHKGPTHSPSKPVNFGDGDLPDYRPYSHRKPSSVTEHFGLAGPQNPGLYQPCACPQHFGTLTTTAAQLVDNQPEYRPQIIQLFEIPSSSTTVSPVSLLPTLQATQVSIAESQGADNPTQDPFQAEVVSVVSSNSDESSRLEEARAEPLSTTGDGWIPMTIQKVMNFVTGDEFSNIHPKRQSKFQRERKESKPNFKKSLASRLKSSTASSKFEFREPRSRAKDETLRVTTTTPPDSSPIQDIFDNEEIQLHLSENQYAISEALDISGQESANRGKKKEPFDHSLNTLATLAQPNLNLLSTTEKSKKEIGLNQDEEVVNLVGFIGSNATKWVWKLQDASPPNLSEAQPEPNSNLTLESLEKDPNNSNLLSDAWFKNYSELPIFPALYNTTEDGLNFEAEVIDLTSSNSLGNVKNEDNEGTLGRKRSQQLQNE